MSDNSNYRNDPVAETRRKEIHNRGGFQKLLLITAKDLNALPARHSLRRTSRGEAADNLLFVQRPSKPQAKRWLNVRCVSGEAKESFVHRVTQMKDQKLTPSSAKSVAKIGN